MLLTTSFLSQCFCIFPENSSNTGNSLLIFRKFFKNLEIYKKALAETPAKAFRFSFHRTSSEPILLREKILR